MDEKSSGIFVFSMIFCDIFLNGYTIGPVSDLSSIMNLFVGLINQLQSAEMIIKYAYMLSSVIRELTII